MSTREDLIWRMAEAAWMAHYCPFMGNSSRCDNCRADNKCFELAGGFKREESWEWWRSAQAALEALESELNLVFFPTQIEAAGAS